MQVKTYLGVDTQEILAQIKAEMGPEAVILSSRDFRKDGRRLYEVTAGVDRPLGPFDGAAGAGRAAPSATTSGAEWEEWRKDWRLIRDHIYALMQPSIQWERLSPRQRVALEFLRREGVDGWVLMELYRHLAAAPGASVLEALERVTPTKPWTAEEWPERLHIMAGPYGGGKTTAALRMALLLRKELGTLKAAFVNADCVRGNGRLVLRHWAELSGFMYLEAADAASMQDALRRTAEADCVFVDLPGVGRGATLAALLGSLGLVGAGGVVHLALPPHYGGEQTQAFLDRYQTGLRGSVVWTKLDECSGYGSLVNMSAVCGLPVSALSYGPGLRGTLVPAREALLWRLVFKKQLPGQNEQQNENA